MRADTEIRDRAAAAPRYCAMRRQLVALRGPAAAHRCAGCGGAAQVWSYDGTDPHERTDPARGHRYSLDPARHRPLCRSCHRRATARGASGPLDVERAAWLYRAGASSRGIAALLDASPSAVLRALRANGVPIRSRQKSRR
ncbi:MAG: hypothetical protein JWO67_2660 [Streptosporangiaceae bacterium]|nr:hypothetical protein [Streptosporangiaceae bacterium]